MSLKIAHIGNESSASLLRRAVAASTEPFDLHADDKQSDDADILVFGADAKSPLVTAQGFLRQKPDSQVLFLLPVEQLARFRASLPFVPNMASAWSADAASTPEVVATLLARAARVGSKRSSTSAVLSKINLQLGRGTAKARADEAEELRLRQIAVSEDYLATLLTQAPDAFIAVSPSADIVAWNETATQMFGVDVEAAIGTTTASVLPIEVDHKLRELIDLAHSGQPVAGHLAAFQSLTGQRWVELSVAPVRDDRGNVATLSITARDVTDRQAAIAALEDSEGNLNRLNADLEREVIERTRTRGRLWQLSPDLLGALNADGYFETSNPAWQSLLGWTEAEVAGMSIFELLHPDDVERTRTGFELTQEGKPAIRFPNRYRCKDGTYRWISWVGIPDHGLVYCTGHDITREKLQEEELAARTAERDRILNNSRDLVVVIGADGVFREVNPAWTAILGHDRSEILGRDFRDFVWPDDEAKTKDGLRSTIAGQQDLTNFENRYRHKDGTPRWISWNTATEGELAYAYGRDITAEKAADEALAQSAAQLRSIVETTHMYQGLLSLDGTVMNANATALKGIDASAEDVIGKPYWETRWFTGTPGMPEAVQTMISQVAHGESVQMEMMLNLPAGPRWFDFSMRALFDGQRNVVALVPEAADITDRRQAEEALRQSQKMEAVGQLTGGIAHDFNNLLAGISGSLELVEKRMAAGRLGDVQRFITAAKSGARRAASLTQRLLAFSRRQTLDPKPVDVNKLIGGMEDLIRRSVGPDVDVEVVGAGGLWTTKVDASQLENALLNLCINARDAMAPAGGRITVETANKWLDERTARERELKPGQYISLCVTDTGTGMPPEVIERVFDPFFTTKPLGEGTGLGLSMVHGFIRQSGGQVRIYSEVGKGTTMCLYLPRFIGDADEAEAEDSGAVDRGEGETVLVIDDEATIRMLIVDVLEESGYNVIEASDGAGGLSVLQSDTRIDLLVTDVGLPGGMNGRQVADAARVTRPDLKILFITGYAENAVVGNGHLEPGMEVITKPFAIDLLSQKIRDLIDS